ncbi:serine--tRNA ligase [Paenibacillus sp. GSMTC-2017]|uniref:serine--tRNA ligase n=1 Tax=Paenibacillus sp. GSMTC-2017 TaxID=2794350 RepID=UPI0018D85E6C|nr:serine--tRNA ligase [Paenibacillus sp. GSMTC-2017]MBH5319791.1 serine--tRNA ligase [Paenibacillus sp. GSMTC-2017]
MLDMKWIRENAEEVRVAAEQKGIDVSIDNLLQWDERKRKLIQETDGLREKRNRLSQQIGQLMLEKRVEEANLIKEDARKVNDRLGKLDHELTIAEEAFATLYELVPNVTSPDTPVGRSDEDNVELARFGEPPSFDFEARDHMALGALHDLIDVPRGVKTAGTRHYYLKGAGVLLHRAVQQLALDLLVEKGFTPLEVPLMARPEAMNNTAFFPTGRDQTYRLEDEDRYLVGTSEVPLVTFHAGEIVQVETPIKLAAASMCFRSEVGSAGRDVHGLYRVHQFAKVEQVVICRADAALSNTILEEITANAEKLLQLLELPYRKVAVCTGDMSQKTYKQYDLETWMPSRAAYGETHSSSNLHDFQARRSNIRYYDENCVLRYCHTLNNTAVASPRILIPLLENHQREDGSIYIPKALRPYMYGKTELVAPQLLGKD